MAKKEVKKLERKTTKAIKTKKKPTKKAPTIAKKCPNCKTKYEKGSNVCLKCGADSKFTPEIEAELKKALQLDYPISKACEYVGITKKTFYTWIKRYPEFAERMRRAKHFASHIARNSVITRMATDGHLALKYLERKEKDEFSTKQFVQEQLPSGELNLDEKRDLQELLKQEGFEIDNLEDLEALIDMEM